MTITPTCKTEAGRDPEKLHGRIKMAYFFKQQGESGRSRNKHPGHMDHWIKWRDETIRDIKEHKKNNAGKKDADGSGERDRK